MRYTIPDRFIKFDSQWHKKYNFDAESKEFANIVNTAEKENDVQKYIKNNKKWFIPAALFKDYDFGHHEAYIIPEQTLGGKYRVDYLLLGRNSIGYQIILVEFEDVNVDFTLKNSNSFSQSVRNGLTQIKDWKRWMEDNRLFLLMILDYRIFAETFLHGA